jgi:hypothetical protein
MACFKYLRRLKTVTAMVMCSGKRSIIG